MNDNTNSPEEKKNRIENDIINEKINYLTQVVINDCCHKRSYSWMDCKHIIENTTSVLLLIELIKKAIDERELETCDLTAYEYFNAEVQNLISAYVALVRNGNEESEEIKKFGKLYKDFLMQYLPHIGYELIDLNPNIDADKTDGF